MVRIRVLGATEISIGQRRIGMNTELLFAIALYLTTRAGERISREDLLEVFWPSGGGEDRRHALRQMLYRLRQKGLALEEEGDWIGLDASAVDSDVRDVIAEGWPEKADAAAVDAAATFMPSFSNRLSPEFHEWLDGVRERVAAQHRRAALRQIYQARREARWSDLERWAVPVLRTDPLNEEATLARAESAAMAGSKTIALEILDNYLAEVGEISDELGRPASLLRKRLAERRPDWATRGPKEVPLVGRAELMSRLTGLVEAAWRGEGSAVVLVGAPGIGKTRLAMEARAYAELKGMRTVVVRAEVGNSERPYALLQTLIDGLLDLPGSAGCDPEAMQVLRRLRSRRTDADLDAGTSIGSARQRVPAAMCELIDAIAHEARVFVHVDDLHNSDSSSLTCLRSVLIGSAGRRISWAITARREGFGESAVGRVEGVVPVLNVSGLTEGDAITLVAMTAAAHRLPLSSRAIEAVAHAAGGNPLFARELSVATASRSETIAIPEGLQRLIEDRLSRLPAMQLRLLRIVALLGSEAMLSVLSRISRIDPAIMSACIETLERDDILSRAELGHLELHECWQRAVIDTLSGAARAALSFECASALLNVAPDLSSPNTKWKTAELLRDAGESAQALRLFIEAADGLYSAGFPHSAVEVLRQAEGLVEAPTLRALWTRSITRALVASGDPASCVSLTEGVTLDRAPSEISARTNVAWILTLRAEALWRVQRSNTDELNQIARAVADARIATDVRQQLCATAMRLAAAALDLSREKEFFSLSQSLAHSAGLTTSSHLVALVFHAENGPPEDLESSIGAALAADGEDLPTGERCQLLRSLARALRLARRVEEGVAAAKKAFELARSRALHDDAFIAAELLAFTLLDEEDLEGAELWINVALAQKNKPDYAQRVTALDHAVDRLDYQRGNYGRILERRLPRLDHHIANPVTTSRTVELAVLAAAMSKARSSERLDEILSLAYTGTEQMAGHQLGDFPTELVAEALSELNQEARASRLLRIHLERRPQAMRHLLAPYCRRLRREVELLDRNGSSELAGPANGRQLGNFAR